MVDAISSLYKMCINEVTDLIMVEYWDIDMPNPFQIVAPAIVSDLVSDICIKNKTELDSSHLDLLLSSGRIINLNIHDTVITLSTANIIFETLLPFSAMLKTIRIRDVDTRFGYFIPETFEILLRGATSLTYLDTSIRFKLENISNCPYLQKLIMDFSFFDTVSSFAFRHGATPLNYSIRVIQIPQFQMHIYINKDIGTILQYCAELLELSHEVTRGIEILHNKNEANRYKLRKTIMGDDIGATQTGIRLTSVYCPDITEVYVSPQDYAAIHALLNFRHITVLTIHEPVMWRNDYHSGVHVLLQNPQFGHNLKSLTLIKFSGVCCASIGVFCPKLMELRLESISETNTADFVPGSYEKLNSLYVRTAFNEPFSGTSIIGFLSNATALEFLTITNASMFDDSVLNKIMRNIANFSQLKVLKIPGCGLTINGLQKLTNCLTSVKSIKIWSSIIKEEDAIEILQPLNLLSFSWTDDV